MSELNAFMNPDGKAAARNHTLILSLTPFAILHLLTYIDQFLQPFL